MWQWRSSRSTPVNNPKTSHYFCDAQHPSFYEQIANSNYNKNHSKRSFFVTHPSYQHCRYLLSNNDEKRCLAREYLQTIVHAMSLVLSIRQILSSIWLLWRSIGQDRAWGILFWDLIETTVDNCSTADIFASIFFAFSDPSVLEAQLSVKVIACCVSSDDSDGHAKQRKKRSE